MIETGISGGVQHIRLNRPEKKNALTGDMYTAFAEALERGNAEGSGVRVHLVTGVPGAFTAGNDIGDFLAFASRGSMTDAPVARFLRALVACERPIVAAVDGLAIGVGTTMLLHCDLVYVARDAKLSTPFVGLALVPEAASSLLLPAAIGHRRAFAMFALGEVLSGFDAAEIGLVNAALPADDVLGAARAAAGRLAQQPIGAIKATKGLMRDAAAIATVMDTESRLFFERLQSPEAREAFTAFAERRKPDFTKLG